MINKLIQYFGKWFDIIYPGGSDAKEFTCNAGATGETVSIPGLGRPPGEVNGHPLQYPCLENAMYRQAWQAKVRGVAESDKTE